MDGVWARAQGGAAVGETEGEGGRTGNAHGRSNRQKRMPSLSSSVPWQSSMDLRIQHMVWKCTNEGFAKEVRFRLVLENPGAIDADQWPCAMCA